MLIYDLSERHCLCLLGGHSAAAENTVPLGPVFHTSNDCESLRILLPSQLSDTQRRSQTWSLQTVSTSIVDRT